MWKEIRRRLYVKEEVKEEEEVRMLVECEECKKAFEEVVEVNERVLCEGCAKEEEGEESETSTLYSNGEYRYYCRCGWGLTSDDRAFGRCQECRDKEEEVVGSGTTSPASFNRKLSVFHQHAEDENEEDLLGDLGSTPPQLFDENEEEVNFE